MNQNPYEVGQELTWESAQVQLDDETTKSLQSFQRSAVWAVIAPTIHFFLFLPPKQLAYVLNIKTPDSEIIITMCFCLLDLLVAYFLVRATTRRALPDGHLASDSMKTASQKFGVYRESRVRLLYVLVAPVFICNFVFNKNDNGLLLWIGFLFLGLIILNFPTRMRLIQWMLSLTTVRV